MELRIDNQLDEKTEIIIRNIIGAAIDVHRELGTRLSFRSRDVGIIKLSSRSLRWLRELGGF